MTDDEWQERLRRAVEATVRARAAKAAQRAEFNTRRAYGLIARHNTKLRRIRAGDTTKENEK